MVGRARLGRRQMVGRARLSVRLRRGDLHPHGWSGYLKAADCARGVRASERQSFCTGTVWRFV